MNNDNIDFRKLTARQIADHLDLYIIAQDEAKQCLAHLICNKLKYKTNKIAKNVLLCGPGGSGKTIMLKEIANFLHLPLMHMSVLKLLEIGTNNCITNIMNKLIKKVIEQRREYWKFKYYDHALKIATDKVESLMQNSQQISGIENNVNIYTESNIEINLSKQAAIDMLTKKELAKLLKAHDFSYEALQEAEQYSLILLDDVDKLCVNPMNNNIEYSQKLEIAQRRLVKLLEGTTVLTEYGNINTNNVIFACAGTFAGSSINNLIPELYAQLPAVAQLQTLNEFDLLRILQEIDSNVLNEYISILQSEDIHIDFVGESISTIAIIAYNMNIKHQNIGVRRLNLLVQELFKPIMFNVEAYRGQKITIDENYVITLLAQPEEVFDYKKYVL